MSSKITLPSFVTLLAMQSGLERQLCEDFMRELLTILISSLGRGETVKVRGLGSFRITAVQPRRSVDVSTGESIEIAAHYKVSFSPSREIAQAVNAPFEAFRSVEIPVSLDLDMDATPDNEENPVVEDDPAIEEIISEENSAAEDDSPRVEVNTEEIHAIEDVSIQEEVTEEGDNVAEEEPSAEEIVSEDNLVKVDNPETHHHRHHSHSSSGHYSNHHSHHRSRRQFNFGFLWGFICASAIAGLIWLIYMNPAPSASEAENYNKTASVTDSVYGLPRSTTKAARPDSLASTSKASEAASSAEKVISKDDIQQPDEAQVPTQPTDKVVCDTISKTRYLTTMAKEHYGNFNFWPYIYEENKARLGHPDRIRPGTSVVIPPLSKYGVRVDNPADVAEAKRRGASIYARFR